MKRIFLVIMLNILIFSLLYSARIKDLVDIKGVRTNQLIGYGIVVGLNGTGDDGKKTIFTFQAVLNMLKNFGINVKKEDIDADNIAAVMVTATLPPFAKPGMKLDVIVSSLGDAKSLQGGTLLMTPLKGPDGKIYAVAQGPVSVGGFIAGGAGGARGKNFPTVGRVPEGAIVERAVPFDITKKKRLILSLREPDFTTCQKIVDTINLTIGKNLATPIDGASLEVKVPEKENIVRFISKIEDIDVTPDSKARIVINERTGTVVIGENVKLSTVAVAHGNLSIIIKETPEVTQPKPLAGGTTVVTPKTNIQVKEEKAQLMLINNSPTIRDLVRGLNRIGVTPRDLISILQAIKEAGALQADIVIM